MSTIKQFTRNTFTSLVVVLQVCAFPLTAYAEEANTSSTDPASTTQTTTTQPVEPAPVPATTTTPVEPAPNPYVLNPETGNYENDEYIWNPTTFKTTPKSELNYSFNPSTGVWETPEHAFNPATQEYAPNIPLSSPEISDPEKLSVDGGQPSSNSLLENNMQNGPYDGDFNNKYYNDYDADHFFSGFYNAEISNNIYSTARSGDATVAQNTVGGNALSGDASAIANLINLLQTSFNPGGSGNIGTFVSNIDGDVVGDIMIDPGAIGNKSLSTSNSSLGGDLKINVENNGSITNNIDLAATSGNATVSKNTQAGDATSGTATAIANVVNMINSSVAAGQSFFGIININGNFNGDILMPPNALDYLLASSAPRTTLSLSDKELNANLTNNQTINNNVNASAESGSATVSKNTQAGSATSGNAETNVTILNLTGSNIIGSNSLLVFVNVLGEWVGLIVDAPTGSTSAAYAGGVSSSPAFPGYDNVDIDSTNNSTITNNINVAAKSGDAEVSNNTMAGDATSGDATAGVNILNIMNSNLALSDWFGVLFINVLGSWHGSFGIDTAAGNPASSNSPNGKPPKLVEFIPGGSGGSTASDNSRFNLPVYTANFYGDVDVTNENNKDKAILASTMDSTNNDGTVSDKAAVTTTSSSNGLINWNVAALSLAILALAIGAERFIAYIRQRQV